MECPGEEEVKDLCSDAAATVGIPMKICLIFCELIHRLKPHALESGFFNFSLFQLIVGNGICNYCITVMKHIYTKMN